MNKFIIVSDAFDTETLKSLLESNLESDEVTLEIQEEPLNTMALDPNVLLAIVTGNLGIVITGLFAVWQKHQENKAKANDNKTALETGMIKIKTSEIEVEVPQSISPEKLEEIMQIVQKHTIKSIALITEV